jgi:dTMP kinase
MSQLPFISLDGLDGTGKTTQCRLLAGWLRARGLPVIDCCDPGGTAIGDAIRDLLLGRRDDMVLPCEAFLFMASRAQLSAEVIRPALEAGRAVVADRYLLANVVYQGHAGGLNPEQLWEIGRLATGGLQPDLVRGIGSKTGMAPTTVGCGKDFSLKPAASPTKSEWWMPSSQLKKYTRAFARW